MIKSHKVYFLKKKICTMKVFKYFINKSRYLIKKGKKRKKKKKKAINGS